MRLLSGTTNYLTRLIERGGIIALRATADFLASALLIGCQVTRRGAATADDYLERIDWDRVINDLKRGINTGKLPAKQVLRYWS